MIAAAYAPQPLISFRAWQICRLRRSPSQYILSSYHFPVNILRPLYSAIARSPYYGLYIEANIQVTHCFPRARHAISAGLATPAYWRGHAFS